MALLALVDTAIVALALPPILRELDTDVAGVAALLAIYAVVLGVALLPAERLRGKLGTRRVGLAGVALFALGSLVCGLAGGIELLLSARAVQAAGGAALLVTAYALLADGPVGVRVWRLAALLGTAAGPAIGGALTQGFGWRSIFLLQVPAAILPVPACLSAPATKRGGAASRLRFLPAAALALLSGAVVAALFLTVLLLISGWGLDPMEGALLVSVMPLSALAATKVGSAASTRAAVGSLIAAVGAAALAFLPTASVAWTIAPQIAVGIGTGLAFPALAGELLTDRGGPIGLLQDATLVAVDVVACRVGSSREELVLALVDDDAAKRYQKRFGLNPRDALDLAEVVLPG